MLKITVAVLAVALAGTASAGWRSLRVDASSEANFNRSVAEFKAELPAVRYQLLLLALEDIWEQGTKTAEAAEAEYTTGAYLRQLDGLGYREIVTFTDPTGRTADKRFRQVYEQLYGRGRVPDGGSRNSSYQHESVGQHRPAWRGTPVGTPGPGAGQWDPSR